MKTSWIFIFLFLGLYFTAQVTTLNDVQYIKTQTTWWRNCGDPASPVQLVNFNVIPEPVILGQLLYLTMMVNISREIGVKGQNVSLDLSIRVKTGSVFKEICDLIENACHKPDFCSFLNKQMSGKIGCPTFLKQQGFNCTCPLKPNLYSVESLPIPIPRSEIDIHGTFEAKAALKDDVSMLSCFEVKFCVNKC